MSAEITSENNESKNESIDSEESKRPSLKRKLDSADDVTIPNKELRLEDYKPDDKDKECDDVDYYFENGLRKVYPYYYTYSTYCKGRWVGNLLCDVFAREFRAYNKEHYEKQIMLGLLKVNNKPTAVDYVLRNNDHITHMVHRHEIAVLGTPIKIIHCDDDVVVIDKPPSVPVHPCGRYRRNSLLSILAKDNDLKELHTVHRLDRLTSGILIFTKTLRKSQELDELIRSHKIHKEYLCRVDGLFPDETITCCEPIETLSKIGVCIINASGKESKTEFKKLSYNGISSLILCKPLTGRMHQIRVHLQYLGYPVVNDPIYNHEEAFGPKKGKGGDTGKSKEKLISDLMEIHRLDRWLKCEETNDDDVDDQEKTKANEILKKILNYNMSMQEYQKLAEKYVRSADKFFIDESCHFCLNKYKDPEPKDLILFLHAFKYKYGTWEFQTDLPIWAQEDWKEL